MVPERGHRDNFGVATPIDRNPCPECGTRLISVPCRTCQGRDRLLFFFLCRKCDGIGETMLCPKFLSHSRDDRAATR
jgi:hypothetical protein